MAATIAWGQRKSIINNAKQLITWMDMSPHEFIMGAKTKDFTVFKKFVHRTFNGEALCFFESLQNLYKKFEGLENAFISELNKKDSNT